MARAARLIPSLTAVALLSYGAWLIWRPAGFIVAALLIFAGELLFALATE